MSEDADDDVPDDEDRSRVGWGLVALTAYVAVELVNASLGDPIGGFHRWQAGAGNGNYRPAGQWFFVLLGLWLYVGAPYLGGRVLLAALRRGGPSPLRRAARAVLGMVLLAAFGRLIQMGFASGAIAWS